MDEIAKLFEKSNGKLNQLLFDEESETYYSWLMDEEGDFFKVDFNFDECATIEINNYSYLTLNKENLKTLLNLIDKSEYKYRETE